MEAGKSGSSVRPYKILEAMKDEGHEVLLLSGDQTGKNRNRSVKEIWSQIHNNKPDICYIESPVYPIMKHSDRKLIKYIHNLNIPIGYFYRDFYRKFPEQFPHKKRRFGKIKDAYLDYLQNATDKVLNFCDIVYFPSLKCSELFHYSDMRALPPACSPNYHAGIKSINFTCIYVGGILNQYDGRLLLDSFHELYKMDRRYHLIMICRETEWNSLQHKLKDAPWLEVHHVSGEDLKPFYQRACLGVVIPNTKMLYNTFLVSVKLFEYIGEGLPVVSVNGSAMKEIIENDKIGITCESDPKQMAFAINSIMTNNNKYKEFQKQVVNVSQNKHTWQSRVRTIIRDLESYKN